MNDNPLMRFTDVEELTVFVEEYREDMGSWFLLAPFFERGIPSEKVRVARVVVEVGRAEAGEKANLSGTMDWVALDRLDGALDDAKFDKLERLEFVLLLSKSEHGQWDLVAIEEILERVESRLRCVAGSGKLVTAFRWAEGEDILSLVRE